MRIGATAAYTYAFCGTGMTLEDYLQSVQTLPTLGLRYFDLEILQGQHIPIYEDKDNAAKLRAALQANDVKVAGFTGWACLELIHCLDAKRHAEGYALFDRIAALAAGFGADYVHLGSDMIREFIVDRDAAYVSAPATRVAIPAGVSLEKVLDDYAARLAKLAGIAASHGLKFALEPRANSLVCGADSFNDVYHRAGHDNLYAALDATHMAYHRENAAMAIGKLGSRLHVFQLCDAVSGQLFHLPLGEGEVDIEGIVGSLARSKFAGYLMLELYRSGKDDKATVDGWYRESATKITRLSAR